NLVMSSLGRLDKIYSSKEEYLNEVEATYRKLKVNWTPVISENAEYEIKDTVNDWQHKSNIDSIIKDFKSFSQFDYKNIYMNITVPILLFISNGKINDTYPLFRKKNYEQVISYAKNIDVFETDANHYELVFNNQD